jgi:hypothetical protein
MGDLTVCKRISTHISAVRMPENGQCFYNGRCYERSIRTVIIIVSLLHISLTARGGSLGLALCIRKCRLLARWRRSPDGRKCDRHRMATGFGVVTIIEYFRDGTRAVQSPHPDGRGGIA